MGVCTGCITALSFVQCIASERAVAKASLFFQGSDARAYQSHTRSIELAFCASCEQRLLELLEPSRACILCQLLAPCKLCILCDLFVLSTRAWRPRASCALSRGPPVREK